MSQLQALADLIGVLEYGDNIPKAAVEFAKQIQAAIIYGYSDDSIMVEGVVEDQAGGTSNKTVWVDKEGFLPIDSRMHLYGEAGTIDDCRKLLRRFDQSVKLEILEEVDGWYWQYKTEWPHKTFEIMEDGEPWCKGIVFLFPKL